MLGKHEFAIVYFIFGIFQETVLYDQADKQFHKVEYQSEPFKHKKMPTKWDSITLKNKTSALAPHPDSRLKLFPNPVFIM